jgi:hypothetical protein
VPIEFGLWRITDDVAVPVPRSKLESEARLEAVLEGDISLLGLDPLMIVGRQVTAFANARVDLLALDARGDVYVIELKRGRTPREVVAQALDYGSWARTLDREKIIEIYERYRRAGDLDKDFAAHFGDAAPDELGNDHQLIIVASELDPSTERIVDYLSGSEVPINAVFFRYLADDGREYLARSWLIDPAQAEVRAARKRRPWNGRDFYVSFGEGPYRHWEDARRYGFVSGGGDPWYSRTLNALGPGHRVFVYLPQTGYAGVGEVTESAQPVKDFMIEESGRTVPLLQAGSLTAPEMDHDLDNLNDCEYVVRVSWLKSVPSEQAFREAGLFANQNTAARLRDTHTIEAVEQYFDVPHETSGVPDAELATAD